jgi:hypothetical protein
MAELGRYDQQKRAESERRVLPEPTVLARGYLQRAGFQRSDLDAAIALMQGSPPAATTAAANGWQGAPH